MDLSKLKQEIPYQWRVQSFFPRVAKAACVAFIDARDVMNLLDEVVGPERWISDYRMIGNQLYAGIGIRVDEDWVFKWDTGSETNVEAEKGQASDAFKRAAVKWGIGRFLYDLPVRYVDSNGPKTEKGGANPFPYVVDANGKRVNDLTAHINKTK